MARLLVLGVAAVQDDLIRRAQGDGHYVIACAGAHDGPGALTADEFHVLNFTDVPALTELARKLRVDAIYSTGSDRAMPVVGQVSEALGLPVLASAETARIANDKLLMRESLGSGTPGNVPFVRVSSIDDDLPDLDFPFIVKPNDAQGQRAVALVHNEAEYRTAVAEAITHSRSGHAIAETYLDGPEISVNGYLVGGELLFSAVSDRGTWDGYLGLVRDHHLPARSVTAETAERAKVLLGELARAIALHEGPIYAQMKVVDGTPYVLEVSPRLDGCHLWRLIDTVLGVDLMGTVARHVLTGVAPTRDDLAPRAPEPAVLEFIAQPPGVMATQFSRDVSEYEQYYYEQGATVRPINGRMDKVGYRIRKDA